ncbi:MAG: glycoside hydrolase family 43 protein [Prevotellaceae bacterium]|nr:glycoside hydrolase family 43 protein [Prevotellaceae bacterium]
MKRLIVFTISLFLTLVSAYGEVRHSVPRDSIIMSDPCILADAQSRMYYMTGTGGRLWKSKDLKLWDGPYSVALTDPSSWMGRRPEIWAAELHHYGDKYYYFATFTNDSIKICENSNGMIPRRASHILVSDSPAGPYRPVGGSDYLPSDRPTLDGTFWIDTDGAPYMVFCGEWLYNNDGTMEAVRLKEDLSGPVGAPFLLFKASASPWSRERLGGKTVPNRVTDGPWLFRTGTGRLGMIWTSWVYDVYTMGVAYSESGTLKGPWIQEPEPLTPPNHGHGMIFKDLNGRNLLSLHSHSVVNGRYVRRPVLFEVDLSGDRLKLGKRIE